MRLVWLGLVVLAVISSGCGGDSSTEDGAAPATTRPDDMVQCLADKGWEAEARPDGSYIAEVPDAQRSEFDAAQHECIIELGLDEPWSLDATQAEAYFDELLDAAACIQEMGYEVAEPPSRQAGLYAACPGPAPL